MVDILHGTPWFLRDVYLGSTTTQNVLVTGWQSQVAASAEGRRHFRHKSLAGEHCCGSNTGCSKAEHEPGGQGHPGMVAAGAHILLLPRLQTREQTLHQPGWRSPLHGSWTVRWKRATVFTVCRHSAYPANAEACLYCLFLKMCNTGWNGYFFDFPLWFSAVPMEKRRKRFCMHLTSLQFLCPELLARGIWKFWLFVWCFEMTSSLAGCKTTHHYWPHHVCALISVPGIVLRHLEILVPEW